jgi:hypothetical protein
MERRHPAISHHGHQVVEVLDMAFGKDRLDLLDLGAAEFEVALLNSR